MASQIFLCLIQNFIFTSLKLNSDMEGTLKVAFKLAVQVLGELLIIKA